MKLQMTKAIYNIKTTFKEMIVLHQKEIENHQRLIDIFSKRAKKTKDYEERLVCMIEAHRNRDHQKGHQKVVNFYQYLEENHV